jgi:ABC-type Mn2+/Zn2+ transport system permease subunit
MARRPLRQWLLIGVACGLIGVFVVRSALTLLVGSVKLLVVLGGLTLVWLFLRGPRDGEP